MVTEGADVDRRQRRPVPIDGRANRTGELLGHLRSGGEATVSELATSMGLSRSTVNERLDRLRSAGLVAVSEPVVQGRGRPAVTHRFSPEGGRILACHVGVSGTRLAITDLSATAIADLDLDVPAAAGPDAVAGQATEAFERMLRDLPPGVPHYGIGVGLPGAMELASVGDLESRWADHTLGAQLADHFEAPVTVARDVELMALGERTGAWPQVSVLLCVKVGTVIGCGIVVDGRIVGGAGGLAGEIGHVRIPGRDETCACGNRGCLNVVAGGGALVRALAADGFDVQHARDVAQLASDGVPQAVAVVRQAGRDIGTALAAAVNLLNPEVVALWGYLLGAEEPLVAGIRETLYQSAIPGATRGLQLVSAELGRNTGVRGAAMMVADTVLAPEAVDARLATDADAHSAAEGCR